MAKATLKIVTAEKKFTVDQLQVIRRVMNVLRDHDLSVAVSLKVKATINNNSRLKIV